VFDRAASYGAAVGPLYSEITSALYCNGLSVPCTNVIYGLGGREIRPEQIAVVFDSLNDVKSSGQPAQPVSYVGVRG